MSEMAVDDVSEGMNFSMPLAELSTIIKAHRGQSLRAQADAVWAAGMPQPSKAIKPKADNPIVIRKGNVVYEISASAPKDQPKQANSAPQQSQAAPLDLFAQREERLREASKKEIKRAEPADTYNAQAQRVKDCFALGFNSATRAQNEAEGKKTIGWFPCARQVGTDDIIDLYRENQRRRAK